MKTKAPKEPKAPKVIRVKTLVISLAVAVLVVASFVAGVVYKDYDQSRVKAEAKALVKDLK